MYVEKGEWQQCLNVAEKQVRFDKTRDYKLYFIVMMQGVILEQLF